VEPSTILLSEVHDKEWTPLNSGERPQPAQLKSTWGETGVRKTIKDKDNAIQAGKEEKNYHYKVITARSATTRNSKRKSEGLKRRTTGRRPLADHFHRGKSDKAISRVSGE